VTAKRDTEVTSIDQIPGFETFMLWIKGQFEAFGGDIAELKDQVKSLTTCVNEGNGKPSLKEQVNLNTTFRVEREQDAKEIRKTVRNARIAFASSLGMLLLNVLVTLFVK